MNERIFEIIQEMNGRVGLQWDDEDKEELAELIVQECVNVLDKEQWDKGEDWECANGRRIIAQIQEHFGVEE